MTPGSSSAPTLFADLIVRAEVDPTRLGAIEEGVDIVGEGEPSIFLRPVKSARIISLSATSTGSPKYPST